MAHRFTIRFFWLSFSSLAVWLFAVHELCADELAAVVADPWPYFFVDPDRYRGPGYYLSTTKIVTCWLMFLAWVKTTDWVSQDLQVMHLKRLHVWVPVVVGTFVFAFLLMWTLPSFIIGFTLMLLTYVVPLGLYIFVYRNPQVDEHQKVLNRAHLRFWFAGKLKALGVKIDAEQRAAHEVGPALQLLAVCGDDEHENQALLIQARQREGYTPARFLLDNALDYRASAVMMDFGEAVGVRYLIDGVWLSHNPQPRDVGEQLLYVFKALTGSNPEQESAQVSGRFAIQTGQRTMPCDFTCKTTANARRVLLRIEYPPEEFATLLDLGMTPKQEAQVKEAIHAERGLVLFSALPTGGLSTTLTVTLNQLDRFLRDFVSLEDRARPQLDIDSVDVKTFDAATGETLATILPTVGRTSPDVIICHEPADAKSVELQCEQATKERLIISTIRAKDSAEALLRCLATKVPREVFADAVQAVLHVRLVRKLCNECREPYAPPPELLAKLGIPAGKVEHLYCPPREAPTVCAHCAGVGYHGRTGVFELLHVDEQIRKILKTKPDLNLLRKAARQAGLRTEQQHGILLVAQGITSLEEVQRALKS
ncbi:MAG: ATPase, T2SS/T4P/T4SS family [Pirellulales bacterium]|nr:ATPase, T2SS/T4P/T4SS family [Pirellulales bacterium]